MSTQLADSQHISPAPAFLSLEAAARALGISKKTIQNEIFECVFPIKTVKYGRRRLVVAADLARYVDELTATATAPAASPTPTPAPAPAEQQKRGRGRPRKVAASEGGAA